MFVKFVDLEMKPFLIPKDSIFKIYKTGFGCNVILKEDRTSVIKTMSDFEGITEILTK